MIDALCGVAQEEDFTLPDGDVESWTVNQVAGWAATKLSARTAQALRTNEVDGALLVELSKADIRTELGMPSLRDRNALSAAIADLAPHKKRGRRAEPAKSQPGWWPSPRSRSEKVDESAPATVIPVAPEAGEAEAPDEAERDMEESLWEAALLVGAPETSMGDAATTVGLLVLMVATQLIFLYVAAQLGHDKAITAETVSEFRKFRVEIAHDVQYYDAARGVSLARKVCSELAYNEVAASQVDQFAVLKTYAGMQDRLWPQGVLLCIIALLVWTFTIVGSVLKAGMTLYSVLRMDCGPARTAWGVMLQLVRLCICCVLAWYGALYLVHTPGIGDLILNAVALEIVLQIDELIFAALGSWRLKRLVGATALPACVPSYAVLAPPVLGAFAFVAALLVAHVQPQRELFVKARDALCAGELDFIYASDAAGIVAWAHTPGAKVDRLEERNYPDGGGASAGSLSMDDDMDWSFREFTVQTVLRQLGRNHFIGVDAAGNATCYHDCYIWDEDHPETPLGSNPAAPSCCLATKTKLPVAAGGSWSVAQQQQRSVADAIVTWNPGCEDSLDLQSELDLQIRGAVGDAVSRDACGGSCPPSKPFCDATTKTCIAPRCADVARYCHDNDDIGLRARLFCPRTCGCDDPHSALVLANPNQGCGRNCMRVGSYMEQLQALPCEDALYNDTAYNAFLDNWEAVGWTWPQDFAARAVKLSIELRWGCWVLPWLELGAANLCVEGGAYWPIRPLSYFCPATCGCRAGDPHCPLTCPPRESYDCAEDLATGNGGVCPVGAWTP